MLSDEKRRLVHENLGIAYAVLAKFKLARQLVDDARGEAMVALCLAAGSYEPSKGAFSTWAWVKVRWHIIGWLERQKGQTVTEASGEPVDAPDEAQGPEDAAIDSDARKRILRAVAREEPRVQQTVLLALEHGATKREVAEHLGCSTSTVARLRKQARESLIPLKTIMLELETRDDADDGA